MVKLTYKDIKQIASIASEDAIEEIRNSLAMRAGSLDSVTETALRTAINKLIETCLSSLEAEAVSQPNHVNLSPNQQFPPDLYQRIREYFLDRAPIDSRASKLLADLIKLEVKREQEDDR